MQSQHGERLQTLNKRKSAAKKKFEVFFYESVATDPGTVATDWRHFRVQSVDTFPGTVELEPAKIQIPRLPYKHYDEKSEFHLDPLQHFLETLQTDPTQIHSNPITMAPP